MDVLTDHVLILVQTCLLFLTWDQVLTHPHHRLQVIYQGLQVIWQDKDQMDRLQVKVDRLQATWQGKDQTDRLQVIWGQVVWDQTDRLQAWIWMETECLRRLLVVKGQTHYLVKVGQLVDRHQVICLQVIQWVNQGQWMADLVVQVICLLLMEWVICIHTWTMQEHIKVQKDLLLEILGQCLVICQPMYLRHQTTQMTVVR